MCRPRRLLLKAAYRRMGLAEHTEWSLCPKVAERTGCQQGDEEQ